MKAGVVCSDVEIANAMKWAVSSITDIKFFYYSAFPEEECDVYFIYENKDFDATQDIIGDIKILTKKKRAVIIIIGSNDKNFNVVKWMRSGVADYLNEDDLREGIIRDSIIGSMQYIFGDLKKIPVVNNKMSSYGKRVTVTKNHNWKSLKNNNQYIMSFMMVSIDFPANSTGRYSKESRNKVLQMVRDEVNRVAEHFGGNLWFWNTDSGVVTFYFDNHVDSSVLASIYLIGHFFLFCIEKLKLNEVLTITISVHTGKALYNKTNTEQITSDLLNSLVHIQYQFNSSGGLVITEDLYKKLSGRLTEYFTKEDYFEGRMLYSLQKNQSQSFKSV